MPDSPPVDAGVPAVVISDEQLLEVMSDSLYPGAKPESVQMVLAYCRARRIDPLLKAVHIVPMQVKVGRDQYVWRDVVMPGIGLYRLQAARTGEHAGTDAPVFGEDVQVGGFDVPAWCSVTVYRLIGGVRASFTAVEYWVENYATASRDSAAPNAMWKRRRRGQLAKCAEAQALRRAFPEETGAQQTADEPVHLEDLDLVHAEADGAPEFSVGRKTALPAPTQPELVVPAVVGAAREHAASLASLRPDLPPVDDAFVSAMEQAERGAGAPPLPPAPSAAPRQPDGPVIGAGEVAYLKAKAKAAKKDLDAVLAQLGGLVLDRLSKADFELVKAELWKGA